MSEKPKKSPGNWPRTFRHPNFVAAGYHEQEWGPVPSADHELIGDYLSPTTGEVVSVRHLAEGPSGHPEFELVFGGDGGWRVTVLDEATALVYLLEYGAVERA